MGQLFHLGLLHLGSRFGDSLESAEHVDVFEVSAGIWALILLARVIVEVDTLVIDQVDIAATIFLSVIFLLGRPILQKKSVRVNMISKMLMRTVTYFEAS